MMYYRYFGDEYEHLIANIFKYDLMNGDLHLTSLHNLYLRPTDVVNTYLEKKLSMWMVDCLISTNPLII